MMTTLSDATIQRMYDPEFELVFNAAVKILAHEPTMLPSRAVYLAINLANTVVQYLPEPSISIERDDEGYENLMDDLLNTSEDEDI